MVFRLYLRVNGFRPQIPGIAKTHSVEGDGPGFRSCRENAEWLRRAALCCPGSIGAGLVLCLTAIRRVRENTASRNTFLTSEQLP